MTTKCSAKQIDYDYKEENFKTAKPVKQTIKSIFDDSDDAVFGVNADGNIGYLNKHCNELLGLPKNINIKGKHCSDLLCGGEDRCAQKCCTECAINQNIESEQQISEYEMTIKQASGVSVKVSVGTCYFYQYDRNEVSTYFSLREVIA
ncbi:MAG: hypothetical protein DIZ80_06980 [endosymbiont of Galathealinum brachiosum]|uniref:PAS domain-containing protein n=1 Tax=endosymbiont of Galathealinum brachiosum TaxID=2200906 RepID=A0A370DG45_9GAMM|nr:MAG: hypothetical protein DIZ80_06980 [endosymbiont of Galathealinum brachiosum]